MAGTGQKPKGLASALVLTAVRRWPSHRTALCHNFLIPATSLSFLINFFVRNLRKQGWGKQMLTASPLPIVHDSLLACHLGPLSSGPSLLLFFHLKPLLPPSWSPLAHPNMLCIFPFWIFPVTKPCDGTAPTSIQILSIPEAQTLLRLSPEPLVHDH